MRRESSETLLCTMKKADFANSFIVSADMDHVAFVRGLGYLHPPRQLLVADGKLSPVYDAVAKEGIAWHPNGHAIAYVVYHKGVYHLAIWDMQTDPILWPEAGVVKGRPVFSTNGDSVAAIVRTSTDSRVIVDGVEVARESLILETPLVLMAGARCVAYLHGEGEKFFVVWGADRYGPYRNISIANFSVSPDGNHIAFEAFSGAEDFAIVVDGRIIDKRVGQGFGESTLRFSPNSQCLAYASAGRVNWLSLQSGTQYDQPTFTGILAPGPIFSPDSKRVAYFAHDEAGHSLFVDNARIGSFDGFAIGHPVFSPDSAKIVFSAKVGNSFRLMLWDGVMLQCLYEEDYVDGHPSWSPDSQVIACRIKREGHAFIRIEDSLGQGFDYYPLGGGVYFLDDHTVGYLATRQDDTYRVREVISPR